MSEHGSRLARRIRRTARLLLPLLLLLPLYAGCKGFETPWGSSSAEDDPLRPGPQIPAGDTPPPPTPQSTAQAQNTYPVPVNPQPVNPWSNTAGTPTGTTPASLVSTPTGYNGSTNPLDDPRKNGPGGTAADPTGWQPVTPAAQPSTVKLQAIEPTGSTPPISPVTPLPGNVITAGGKQPSDSVEQCSQILKGYGMEYIRTTLVDNKTDTYKCECAIANKQQPNVRKNYVYTGIGQVGAMRAVIDAVAKDQGVN